MCLNTVTSTERDRKREGVGWKVFEVVDGRLKGLYRGGPWKKRRWLQSVDDRTENYPLGFHMFRTRKDARKEASFTHVSSPGPLRVVKVKFRDVVTTGLGNMGERIIVAKEMLILEN